MWFVSLKKYNELKRENDALKDELKHTRLQMGALAVLYREEIDTKQEKYARSK